MKLQYLVLVLYIAVKYTYFT